MDLGLSGRTALVCGASSGLGLASAEALAEEGANVVLFARRAEQLSEHAARLGGVAVAGDVNDDADLERAVSTAVERFGGLDVLVWNGGGPRPGSARDADEASLESAVPPAPATRGDARPPLPPAPGAQPGRTHRRDHARSRPRSRRRTSRSRTRSGPRSRAG